MDDLTIAQHTALKLLAEQKIAKSQVVDVTEAILEALDNSESVARVEPQYTREELEVLESLPPRTANWSSEATVKELRGRLAFPWPCHVLRKLRKRAELTQEDMVLFARNVATDKPYWPLADAGSAYAKFENPRYQTAHPYSEHFIAAMADVFICHGQGNITLDEVQQLREVPKTK